MSKALDYLNGIKQACGARGVDFVELCKQAEDFYQRLGLPEDTGNLAANMPAWFHGMGTADRKSILQGILANYAREDKPGVPQKLAPISDQVVQGKMTVKSSPTQRTIQPAKVKTAAPLIPGAASLASALPFLRPALESRPKRTAALAAPVKPPPTWDEINEYSRIIDALKPELNPAVKEPPPGIMTWLTARDIAAHKRIAQLHGDTPKYFWDEANARKQYLGDKFPGVTEENIGDPKAVSSAVLDVYKEQLLKRRLGQGAIGAGLIGIPALAMYLHHRNKQRKAKPQRRV